MSGAQVLGDASMRLLEVTRRFSSGLSYNSAHGSPSPQHNKNPCVFMKVPCLGHERVWKTAKGKNTHPKSNPSGATSQQGLTSLSLSFPSGREDGCRAPAGGRPICPRPSLGSGEEAMPGRASRGEPPRGQVLHPALSSTVSVSRSLSPHCSLSRLFVLVL